MGSTGVTFPDATIQTTAAVLGVLSQVFTASGTFTIPTGVSAIKVTVIGGGGGGGNGTWNGYGGCCYGHGWGGAGGGGGGGIQYFTGLTPGGTLTVTVGGGGAIATAGGTSSVASGTQAITTISCTGGGGGQTINNGYGASGANGSPTGNSFGLAGFYVTANILPTAGGVPPFGFGQGGAISTGANNGTVGIGYGAGGSGGGPGNGGSTATYTGAVGKAGIVIIEW